MPKLFMFLLGATPPNRMIEQHDVFFDISNSLTDLLPSIKAFWPEAKEKLHIDGFREIANVNGHRVEVIPATENNAVVEMRLFFINLGGYKPNEFEEFHYKMLVAAKDKGDAIAQSKQTAFFKHTGFKGAPTHVDDKYGVDVDDIFEIRDILPVATKKLYRIVVHPRQEIIPDDELYLGYYKLDAREF